MHLLKDILFYWDDQADRSFEALKKALTSAPILSPPDFSRDFLHYLAASESIMGIVLVQEGNDHLENMIYYLSRALIGPELAYSHVDKLALAAVHAIQRLCHYLIVRKTTIIAILNLFQYILTRRLEGGKYSKWIVILQEFELEFISAKANKSLVFAELISELPRDDEDNEEEPNLKDEHLFLNSSLDPWCGDYLVYLQMLKLPSHLGSGARRHIRKNSRKYVIIGDTLYNRGIGCVLRRCLTHEEAEKVLNDYHSGACSGHLSGLATTQNILCAGFY